MARSELPSVSSVITVMEIQPNSDTRIVEENEEPLKVEHHRGPVYERQHWQQDRESSDSECGQQYRSINRQRYEHTVYDTYIGTLFQNLFSLHYPGPHNPLEEIQHQPLQELRNDALAKEAEKVYRTAVEVFSPSSSSGSATPLPVWADEKMGETEWHDGKRTRTGSSEARYLRRLPSSPQGGSGICTTSTSSEEKGASDSRLSVNAPEPSTNIRLDTHPQSLFLARKSTSETENSNLTSPVISSSEEFVLQIRRRLSEIDSDQRTHQPPRQTSPVFRSPVRTLSSTPPALLALPNSGLVRWTCTNKSNAVRKRQPTIAEPERKPSPAGHLIGHEIIWPPCAKQSEVYLSSSGASTSPRPRKGHTTSPGVLISIHPRKSSIKEPQRKLTPPKSISNGELSTSSCGGPALSFTMPQMRHVTTIPQFQSQQKASSPVFTSSTASSSGNALGQLRVVRFFDRQSIRRDEMTESSMNSKLGVITGTPQRQKSTARRLHDAPNQTSADMVAKQVTPKRQTTASPRLSSKQSPGRIYEPLTLTISQNSSSSTSSARQSDGKAQSIGASQLKRGSRYESMPDLTLYPVVSRAKDRRQSNAAPGIVAPPPEVIQ